MRKSFVSILVLLFFLSITTGCSFNFSASKAVMDIKFNEWQLDKEKSIIAPRNSSELVFNYSNFNLEEGELVLYLFDKEKYIVYERVWKPEDGRRGKFAIENLGNGQKYSLLLRGREAKNGSIKIEW